jgi:GT2 family glycosyltransferase
MGASATANENNSGLGGEAAPLCRVIAVVVTRNRSALLKKCLDGIARQTCTVAEVLVIDNASTDDTESVVTQAANPATYLKMEKNLGSSGGFHEGVRRGFEKGYDWFWVMDDDLVPEPDCLKKLTSSPCFMGAETGMLAAVVKTPEGGLEERSLSRLLDIESFRTLRVCDSQENGNRVERINCSTFLGLLVSRTAVERVGLPKKEFFISCDDVEYCLRIDQAGLMGYLIWDAVVVHFSPNVLRLKKLFLPAYTHIPKNALWKAYCGYRNLAYVIARHCNTWAFLRAFLRLFVAILVYDDCKVRRWNLLCKGFWNGWKGQLSFQDVMSLLPTER